MTAVVVILFCSSVRDTRAYVNVSNGNPFGLFVFAAVH